MHSMGIFRTWPGTIQETGFIPHNLPRLLVAVSPGAGNLRPKKFNMDSHYEANILIASLSCWLPHSTQSHAGNSTKK